MSYKNKDKHAGVVYVSNPSPYCVAVVLGDDDSVISIYINICAIRAEWWCNEDSVSVFFVSG